jgi:parvulin-like peptidyl-prolyl isomerase
MKLLKPLMFSIFGVMAFSGVNAHAQLPALTTEVLARSAKQTVNAIDHRTYHYALTDSAYIGQLKNPNQVKQSLDEILTIKEFASNRSQPNDLSEQEKSFIELSAGRARYLALQSVFERRAKDIAEKDSAGLEKRAKEIYLTTEPAGLKRELSADFQHILFDLRKRSFAETSERIKAAEAALAAGKNFDEVVAQFSDEERAKETKGKFEMVSALSMDGVLARTLFDELKPGQHSKPTVSRLGLHIVKLIALHQPKKRPYDEVKASMYNKLIEDEGRAAKAKVANDIRTTETTFDESAMSKFVLVPDAQALALARQISLESARRAKEQAATAAPKTVGENPAEKP